MKARIHHLPVSPPPPPRSVRRPDYDFRLALFLILLISHTPTSVGLKCYVCSRRENPSYTIDANPSFRIVDNLPRDYCRRLEEVECDRDHDVCFTILQYQVDESGRPPRAYSISKGCYTAPPLGFLDHFENSAAKKRRCRQDKVQIKEEIRTGAPVKQRRINTHQAMKHTCVCSTNRCNGAASDHRTVNTVASRWHYLSLSSWSVWRLCILVIGLRSSGVRLLLSG